MLRGRVFGNNQRAWKRSTLCIIVCFVLVTLCMYNFTFLHPIPHSRPYMAYLKWEARFKAFNSTTTNETLFPTEIGDLPKDAVKPAHTDYLITSKLLHNHMDVRWADATVARNPRVIVGRLSILFQAWSRFSEQENIISWISHGTLIGWSWNQKLLPWDVDIDVQTTTHELQTNMLRLNQTTFEEGFFFDVNKHHVYRGPQSGNQIDARFIDMSSGLYIDITGLSKNPSTSYLQCKTPHFYEVGDIFPLHKILFEDVFTWAPNRISTVLRREYGHRVALPAYRYGHDGYYIFSEEVNQWKRSTSSEYVNAIKKMGVRPVKS